MPQRIQLSRQKGWRLPAGAISVARPTRWGNPYRVGDGELSWTGSSLGPGAGQYDPGDERWCDQPVPGTFGLTPEMAVAMYRDDLEWRLVEPGVPYDEIREAFAELRGHDLACWCPLDQPCHADVLLELANA